MLNSTHEVLFVSRPKKSQIFSLYFLLLRAFFSPTPRQSSAMKCWPAFWMKTCSKHTTQPCFQAAVGLGVCTALKRFLQIHCVGRSPEQIQKVKIQKRFSFLIQLLHVFLKIYRWVGPKPTFKSKISFSSRKSESNYIRISQFPLSILTHF